MGKCIFSVIMPCYNSEAYISKAVDSILNQTYHEWELVAVNDGSTDNTLNILNQYAEKDKRIKVFSKENGGYATAVNFGLDKISGDYFLFLGSDDYLGLDLFERLCGYFEEFGLFPDMVAFRTRVFFKENDVGCVEQYTNFEWPLSCLCGFKEFTRTYPEYAAIFQTRDTSRCYKRELLGDTRYFGKTGMDADGIFSMLICHKAHSFSNVPVDGYFWYKRKGSVSSSMSLKKRIDRISNWHEFFRIISEKYANEITDTEKEYLRELSHLIVRLSSTPKTAFEYRKFIKNEARFTKEVSKKFNIKHLKYLNIVEYVPVMFSLAYLVYSFLEKIARIARSQGR